MDEEIAAIRELYRLLKPFDRAAQERITGYVGARLLSEASAEDQTQANLVPSRINPATGAFR